MIEFMYSAGVYIIDQAISVICKQEALIVALRFHTYIESVQMYKRYCFCEAPSPTLDRYYFICLFLYLFSDEELKVYKFTNKIK